MPPARESKIMQTTVRLRTDDYRALPIPYSSQNGKIPKLGTCYVRVEELPESLQDWMKVNPRIPLIDKKTHLRGPVAKAIVDTLIDEPEMMCVRNNGITLLVEKAEHTKETGGQGILTLTLSDPGAHGIVNGGHTFAAIREASEHASKPDPWNATVRLHIYEGLEAARIPDIAEGLNRSLQVNDASLANLQGTFEDIKAALNGKQGFDQIAYKQGDTEDVDILFVLTLMGMINLSKFPNRKSHPNTLFGQQKAVLQGFVEDAGKTVPTYKRILPKLHEVLVLSDLVQREAASRMSGRLKVTNSDKQNRVRSPKHKQKPAHFAGGTIGGHIPVGWIYPMVAAFRANIDPKKWDDGEFEWLDEPISVLDATIAEMCEIITQEHTDNKNKPAEVGRKEAAYRGCYGVVTMELAGRGKLAV